ncbi:hypothetical protein AAKU67_004120 [Oxalobacteraceae bacterium GrIS 2.11]
MRNHFKKVDLINQKSVEKRVYFSVAEAKKIRRLAEMRHLTVANYLMRAGLGKKADAFPADDAISALSNFARALENFHKIYELENHLAEEKIIVTLYRQSRSVILHVAG